MKIYFAGPIRGGGNDGELYKGLILHLKSHGEVIGGEHADDTLLSNDHSADNRLIHTRDKKRLDSADMLVAEVTTPSLGVGYEIGHMAARKKRILCLFRPEKGNKLSAMIVGSPDITVAEYRDAHDAKKKIDEFFKQRNSTNL